MLLSKINSLAHLRAAPCNDLHATKLAPGKEKEPLESQYQVGPLLGSGGFGSVYSGIRVADNLPVAIKHVEKDRISDWGELVSEPEPETLSWVGGWRRACRNRRANPRPHSAAQWHPSAHGSGPVEEGELGLLGRH